MTDTLRCRCGGEVRVVRLTPDYLTLGHVRNPKDKHHVVRLSRSAAERPAAGLEDSRRQTGAPAPVHPTSGHAGSSRSRTVPDRATPPGSFERSSAAEVERVPPLRAPSAALGARRP